MNRSRSRCVVTLPPFAAVLLCCLFPARPAALEYESDAEHLPSTKTLSVALDDFSERSEPPIDLGPNDGAGVSNVFFQTPLTDALADVAMQTGTTIVCDPTVQGLVTCELDGEPLERALEILLAGNGYVYRKMDGYFLVGSTDPESPAFQTLCDTRSLRLNYLAPQSAQKVLPQRLARYVAASEDTQEISVTAPPALADIILERLQAIDTPPRQVVLDARIVVMETGRLADVGMQWTWPRALAGAYTNSETWGVDDAVKDVPWGLQVGYAPNQEFTNSLSLALNLLEVNDEATVMANPKLMVQDGGEAEINVGTEEYFEILTTGYYTSSELEKIEAGIVLKIRPQVAEDDQIILEIETEVSDVVARGEDNLPVVTRRKASSTLRIEDGGTAAVAGLDDHRTRRNVERVPLLWRIPWFGRLFQNDSSEASDRQAVVFVTAHLMDAKASIVARKHGDVPQAPRAGADFDKALYEALKRMEALP